MTCNCRRRCDENKKFITRCIKISLFESTTKESQDNRRRRRVTNQTLPCLHPPRNEICEGGVLVLVGLKMKKCRAALQTTCVLIIAAVVSLNTIPLISILRPFPTRRLCPSDSRINSQRFLHDNIQPCAV